MSAGSGLDPALSAPLGAALCYGVAAAVQQVGARRAAAPPSSAAEPPRQAGDLAVQSDTSANPRGGPAPGSRPGPPPGPGRLGPGLVAGVLRQPLFLAGVGLDAVGFLLAFVGLRHLPVFVVQAGVSSTVAVTALLGRRFLGDRLTRGDWWLVVAVVAGLTLVGGSAAAGEPPRPGRWGAGGLVGGVAVLALAGRGLDRRSASPAALGALSGVGFGGFALAARLLPAHDGLAGPLADPVLWAAVGYAAVGLGLYGAALQRGSVTAVTAAAVATEALFPSAVGLLFLSDSPRPGLAAAAVAGFLLTVGGALWLAVSQSRAGGCRYDCSVLR